MHVLDWLMMITAALLLIGLVGFVADLMGARRGFREGWDAAMKEAQYRIEFDYKSRNGMVEAYREQRDSAQAELAAAHVERDGLLAMNRRLLDRCNEAESGRDALFVDRDNHAAECGRLARCLDSLIRDLGKMEAAAHAIVGRSEVMIAGRSGAAAVAGGTAVGDDGPGDEDDEPEDEDEDDMDEDGDPFIDDFDLDDDDDDTCPDCGEDWDDCDCESDDDDDLDDDDVDALGDPL